MEDAGVQSNSEVLHNSAVENSEDTPLIEKTPFHWSVLAVRYHNTRKCISSKAALLILFWSFTVSLANGLVINPDTFMQVLPINITLAAYGIVAFALIFYPLAGFLADVKFGRYKTVLRSLYIIIPSLIITLLALGTGIPLIITYCNPYCKNNWVKTTHFWLPELQITMETATQITKNGLFLPKCFCNATAGFFISITMFIIAGLALFVLLFVGFTGFTANIIQFGMDQLHDSPGEDRTLFIHWYVWIYFVSVFITRLALNLSSYGIPFFISFDPGIFIAGVTMMVSIPIILTVLLIVSVCLGHYRRRWFLIEPGRVNPYKLVYRVSKFAYQHRIPVQRSAFTYCEDELPSGLDLGKDKYGGPFTTEEVEDVKAFYGILKVLFSFGMVFFLDFAANSTLPLFALHNRPYAMGYDDYFKISYSAGYNKTSQAQEILLNKGVLSPLLVVVCIPLYLFLLRPFISYYIPGMLKRMGIGMCLVLLSLMLTFSLDTAIHYYISKNSFCMLKFRDFWDDSNPPSSPELGTTFNNVLVVQNILSALSNMLIYIAVFEFICSQSPHSMKGLLIGLSYAIKGLYQMFAASLAVPYIFWYKPLPSCGFGYYLMNILIGVFAVVVYVCVARRYKYRERDERCHVHRYAEEYYSNTQQERYYDYD